MCAHRAKIMIMREHNEVIICKPKRETSEKAKSAENLTLDF